MKSILNLLAIFCTIYLALFLVGAGAGFLLHWAMPSVDIGMSILIGVVTAAFTGHAFFATIKAIEKFEDAAETDEETDPERFPALVYLPPARRRRRRK